ncbi:MAG: LysE family translocator [Rhodobacterales bacterium]|nr:LysE family translocator [Rhodobacterales bacterium]
MIDFALPVPPATLGAFVLAALAIVLSPGPDTLLILRHTIASGRRVGLATVAGVQLGLLVHTAMAVGGLSLIIASSPALFRLVAVAGALYLGWLGLQGFREGGALHIGAKAGPETTAGRACRQAILTNVLNPKVILLFLALFPNFVDRARPDVPAQLATLAAALIVVNTLYQAPLAWAADVVRRWVDRPGVQTWVARGTGAIFIGFAVLLLLDHAL